MNTPPVRFTPQEEKANYVTHGAGAMLGVVALIAMLAVTISRGSLVSTMAVFVYGLSLIVLFTSSALNHWLPAGDIKEKFFTFDQIAVYFLIAGTYTPISVIAFQGTQGMIYLGIEWALFVAGVFFKLRQTHTFEKGVDVFSILTYVIMGWLIFIDIPFAISRLSLPGFLWIAGGGLAYTVGTVFFKLERLRWNHLIWHLLVLTGAAMHFVAIWFYVL